MPGEDQHSLKKLISNKGSKKMKILFFSIIIMCCFLNTYQRNGIWKEGTALWSDCVLKSPNKARAHTSLGTAYSDKYMMGEAISEFKKALAITPHYVEAHYNLGVVYGEKGMLDEAIFEYKQALTINPNYIKAHTNLGVVYRKKGRLDEAIAEYEEALRINPNYVEAHYNLGVVYGKKGRLDEAIAEYRKTLSINPNYAKAYNNIAWFYATSPRVNYRNGEEAVSLATKACELTQFKNAGLLDTLAAAYAEAGNFKKAIEYQNKAIDLSQKEAKLRLLKRLELYQSSKAYRSQ